MSLEKLEPPTYLRCFCTCTTSSEKVMVKKPGILVLWASQTHLDSHCVLVYGATPAPGEEPQVMCRVGRERPRARIEFNPIKYYVPYSY